MKQWRAKGGAAAWIGMAVLAVALAACQREPAEPAQADKAAPAMDNTPAASAPAAADTAGPLKDVIEHDPRYVVGISYPPGLERYPGLATAVRQYGDAARAELMQAVEGLGNDKPTAPYELSLAFQQVLDTPAVVAIAADGSRYTGGAHGEPLVARFVWLPGRNELLTADKLIPNAAGWGTVGQYVATQLHDAAAQRTVADKLEPSDAEALLKNADKSIAEGTAAEADNFAQFVPVLDGAGKIAALRFVFPPYQVGPYSDGTQTADVPAAVLRPLVAPEYTELFAP
ncbi:hypothetical protein ARC20_05705 [Stenotrophomonas panacihumi]|uniref:Deacetylase PdaC domain-containing protein n=1 Tax=Stenotrophomonas panacihumi TaxID=676599 RepID=A0A0R0AM68_9GAMM|nr:DUF3298 and DUF4163 domain-containing protein [Stenotrophomonas panacihumi]KRG46347.1 hypothetical protein ARC20_05705 [Stenotrophomonas panacihumi]